MYIAAQAFPLGPAAQHHHCRDTRPDNHPDTIPAAAAAVAATSVLVPDTPGTAQVDGGASPACTTRPADFPLPAPRPVHGSAPVRTSEGPVPSPPRRCLEHSKAGSTSSPLLGCLRSCLLPACPRVPLWTVEARLTCRQVRFSLPSLGGLFGAAAIQRPLQRRSARRRLLRPLRCRRLLLWRGRRRSWLLTRRRLGSSSRDLHRLPRSQKWKIQGSW
jgi:hypothetical protein